jgi:type I restriction enzyme, S subunit
MDSIFLQRNGVSTKVSAVQTAESASPDGWAWYSLGSLGRLESGHTPSRSRPDWWGGEIPWIALPDIRALDGRHTFETLERTNPEGIAHSAARILPAGTVVLSRTASVGFVTIMGRPMATSQDFVNWVCGPDLDPEFLMHLFIRSRERFRSLSAGAVHQTVYFPTAMALRVCVPSINAQRQIVERLREQLAEIDQAKVALHAGRKAIDALPAALLREVFGASPVGG